MKDSVITKLVFPWIKNYCFSSCMYWKKGIYLCWKKTQP